MEQSELEENLRRLRAVDRLRVLLYALSRWTISRFLDQPGPVRLALLTFFVASCFEFLASPTEPVIVLILWTTSCLIATTICLLLPVHQRTAHWI